MTLRALAYRSKATGLVTAADLVALLFDARAFNAHSDVTGVLLVAHSRFFQYIEGPDGALGTVFSRILASRLHHELDVLFEDAVPARAFDTWHMGFAKVPESIFLRIAQADWQVDLGASRRNFATSRALQDFIALWRENAGFQKGGAS